MVENRQRLRVRVRGYVQGVGFRYFTKKWASLLGLGGWVRNEPDGSVLIEVEGDPAAIKKLLEKVAQGPPAAMVESVTIEGEEEPKGERTFRVRYF